jgi:RNA polymerase sigma factor (sigma-70 family)
VPKPISQKEWDEYYSKVYGYFYRRIESKFEVEELTANTMNDFFLTEKKLENPNVFLWAVARNKLISHIKTKKLASMDIDDADYINEEEQDKVYSIYYEQRMEKLLECMRKQLKKEDQEIIELSVMEDFSSKNIGIKLDLKADVVRKRLSRGIKKLKQNCKEIWVKV